MNYKKIIYLFISIFITTNIDTITLEKFKEAAISEIQNIPADEIKELLSKDNIELLKTKNELYRLYYLNRKQI